MYLILIRHGEAEYRYECDDAARALTQRGKERLEAFFPLLLERCKEALPNFSELRGRILSSPKIRAQQTAELLAKAFHLPAATLCEGLAGYDLQTMISVSEGLDALPGTSSGAVDRLHLQSVLFVAESTGSDLLFLVGHEPMISEWIEQLCGKWLHISKGSASCLEWEPPSRHAAKWLWHMSPLNP